MEKLTNRRFLAIAGLAGLLVAGGLLWRAGQPALRFIGHRSPVYHRQARSYTSDVYCFEDRFSDLSARASAELYARGFRDDDRGIGSPEHDRIFVKGRFRQTQVRVMAFAFDKATADSIVWVPRPGWVSVEVRRIRRPLWTQLPLQWQIWYQFHLAKRKAVQIRRP